jgi:hypothetical protein
MNGINIQGPWSSLLINGQKTIETRSYPLPKKYRDVTLALIETPGGKKFKSRIIGTITFSDSFKYDNETSWASDYNRHYVRPDDIYGWNDKPKYGWIVKQIVKFDKPVEPPKKRGIVFSKDCIV